MSYRNAESSRVWRCSSFDFTAKISEYIIIKHTYSIYSLFVYTRISLFFFFGSLYVYGGEHSNFILSVQ